MMGMSQTRAWVAPRIVPTPVSGFVNLRKFETDREQPVLLAHRPSQRSTGIWLVIRVASQP
jgi:hypothetical protein